MKFGKSTIELYYSLPSGFRTSIEPADRNSQPEQMTVIFDKWIHTGASGIPSRLRCVRLLWVSQIKGTYGHGRRGTRQGELVMQH